MEMVGTQCHPVVPTLCLEVSRDAAMAAQGERGHFKMSRERAPVQGGLLASDSSRHFLSLPGWTG